MVIFTYERPYGGPGIDDYECYSVIYWGASIENPITDCYWIVPNTIVEG